MIIFAVTFGIHLPRGISRRSILAVGVCNTFDTPSVTSTYICCAVLLTSLQSIANNHAREVNSFQGAAFSCMPSPILPVKENPFADGFHYCSLKDIPARGVVDTWRLLEK